MFRERYFEMLHIGKYRNSSINEEFRSKPRRLNLLHVLVGMIPAGILGVLFDDFIEAHLFSVPTVMIGLFLGAIYMIIADKYSKKFKTPSQLTKSIMFKHS